MVITNGELRDYWKKLADAVSGNKMNVSEADVLTALMALGQKIEDVENELTAIRTTDGIKKIEETVPVELTGSNIPETQAIPTKRIGKNTQYVVLVNAKSIPAGGNTGWVAIDPQGCKKIILWVVCDKQWKMVNNTPTADISSYADHLYPDTFTNVQTPTISVNYPFAIVPGVLLKRSNVNNVPDALLRQFFWPNMKIRLSNEDTDAATVTIRAQLIWD